MKPKKLLCSMFLLVIFGLDRAQQYILNIEQLTNKNVSVKLFSQRVIEKRKMCTDVLLLT